MNDADIPPALEEGLPQYPSGPDMPFVVPFEVFPPAPALTGDHRRADLSPKLYFSHPDDIDERIAKVTDKDGTLWAVNTKYGFYERFLAKVAHSFAVSAIGLDKFDPFLPRLIIGEAPWDHGLYVGCTKEWPQLDCAHLLLLDEKPGFIRSRINPQLVEERQVLTARIKLFDFLNSPLYEVVVGTPKADSTRSRLLKIQSTL